MSSENTVFVEADAVTDEEPHDQKLEPVEPSTEPKPAKTRKPPRKPMDEETKERLLKQLAKGRETAMMNRKKRAEAKKLKAQPDQPPRPTDVEHEFLKKELSDVKLALKELLSQNDIRDARHQIKTPPKEVEPIEEMTTAMPTVTPPPPRIATSKGIRSRWDKYA